ncbi:MAG: bifunctional UDP-3-O-[3-hydroxymyristoyl] N-acetylglucosamine deacetylase/3-hydroxyacyl-ACP dehydratase [Elusimicrobiota bacterium]
MEKQTTIKHEVALEGKGLHTGNSCKVVFKPAPAGFGVKFTRSDLSKKPTIEADFKHVLGVTRGTVIGNKDFQIHTIEHILATCMGLKIDNLEICLTNNEPPVLDGSAREFANKILETGLEELDAERQYLTVTHPVVLESGNTKLIAEPSDRLTIDCTIGFDHPFLKHQQASFDITPEIFVNEIAPSRTFCFDFELEALTAKGLAKGGSFHNAIVIGHDGIRNPEKKLRFPDEFVRHKILDLLGDLFLIGKPLKAKITAVRCGHSNNINFAKEISKNCKIAETSVPEEGKTMETKETTTAPAAQPKGKIFDINAIQKLIPHRYPFLMIDRVEILEDLKRANGYKCVSGNENFFQGHFPGQPIMPGVLIVEAMAQTTCVLFLANPEFQGKLAYFMSIDAVKFRKPVIPGDVLELRVEVLRSRERGGKARGEAYVNGSLVTEAEFMFAIVENEGQK